MKILFKHFLYLLLFASVSLNFIVILVEFNYRAKIKRLERMALFQNTPCENIDSFKKDLVNGSIDILHKGIDVYVPRENGWIKDHFYDITKKQYTFNDVQYNWSEMGFLMSELLSYAQNTKNKSLVLEVKNQFDMNILNNVHADRTDQCIYGKVAIQLYDIFKDKKYKDFADNEYNWLKKRNTPDFGIKYITDSKGNAVDGIGTYNPFLIEYSKYFAKPEAYQLALEQIEFWCEHGVDIQTGLPCVGFSTLPPYEKHGTLNWGRGCSWYAIGLLNIKVDDLSLKTKELVQKFNETIKVIWLRERKFSQFIGQNMDIDFSATAPLLYYMYKNNIYTPTHEELLSYSQYMDNNIMWYSSGACRYAGGPYINSGSSQRLSQAFMLKLLNEVK